MFRNAILRHGVSNADGKFRKLFPKGRIIIVHIHLTGDDTEHLMLLANQAADHLAPYVDALSICLALPHAKKNFEKWHADTMIVLHSWLGRGSFNCHLGASFPLSLFEQGFETYRRTRCQFVYFWNDTSDGLSGVTLHRYQSLRENYRHLLVFTGFSTLTADEVPLTASAARARALGDSLILSGSQTHAPYP